MKCNRRDESLGGFVGARGQSVRLVVLTVLIVAAGCGGSSGTPSDGGGGHIGGSGGSPDARGGGGSTDARDAGGGTGTGGVSGTDARDGGTDTDGTTVNGDSGADTGGSDRGGDAPDGPPSTTDTRTDAETRDAETGADGADAGVDEGVDTVPDMGPAPECTTGGLRCVGTGSQMCDAAGRWGALMPCQFGCAAATGMCNGCTDDDRDTTCSSGRCGPTINNCGRTVDCFSSCPGTGETCGGGTAPGFCGCSDEPTTVTCRNGRCGNATNNCGRSISCGTCKPAGTACAVAAECATGFCEQGLCCATACVGTCRSCAVAGAGGTCQVVLAGQDPLNQCADSGPTTCGTDGTCDGSGSCRLYAAGTICVAAACAAGTVASARTCDGAGTCGAANTSSCAPYVCAAATPTCGAACAGVGDCMTGYNCVAGLCKAPLGNTTPCTGNAECASGFCVDGVCCNSACAGTCQACNLAGTVGVCSLVPDGQDPSNECADQSAASCGTDGSCNGAGACRLYAPNIQCAAPSCTGTTLTTQRVCNGTGTCGAATTSSCLPFTCGAGACKIACASDNDCAVGNFCGASATCLPKKATGTTCAGNSECISAACTDDVCCESACAGTCQACASSRTGQTSGLCRPVAAGTDPDAECAQSATSTCGNDGQCDGAGACRRWAAGTACAAGTCSGATFTSARACDGSGTCQPATIASCAAGYACGGSACNSSCAGNSDCAGGYFCAGAACQPVQATGSACTTSAACASGSCVDGVCCESACAGLCMACATSRTGQANGLCRAVSAGSDPDAECAATEPSACGNDGQCDGAGACRRWVAGTVCNGPSCSGSTATPARTCNGTGTCQTVTPASCGSYACDTTACKTTCGGDGDCVSPAICGAGGRPTQCGVPATLTGATSYGFGSIEVGTASDPLTPGAWTITNTGGFATAPLTIMKSTAEIAYTIEDCSGVVLMPGQYCSIMFTFAPAVIGARSGTITVAGAAGESAQLTVTATGVDTTPPAWQAGPTVLQVLPVATTLSVSWSNAIDAVSPAASIHYVLCWSTSGTGCAGTSFTAMRTSAPGATSATITGLATRTPYTVWVRAVDQAGNAATGDHAGTATTATSYATDLFPNTFGGICATCHPGQWSRASTVNVASSFDAGGACGGVLKYINPGSPGTSYIFHKLNENGSTSAPFSTTCPDTYNGLRMPRNGPYDTTHISIMYDWIAQGALDN